MDMKQEEDAKEGKACSGTEKENAFSVSYGEGEVDVETEEGEIGVSPQLKYEKTAGNQKDLLSAVTSSENNFADQEKLLAVFTNRLFLALTGPGTVKSADMNQRVNVDDLNKEGLCEGPANKKLKTVTGVETGCSIVRRDTSVHKFASRKFV